MVEQEYIYESPDGGHTVYRRHPGKLDRELYKVSQEKQDQINQIQEDKLWSDIRRRAQQDPALQEMLDQLRIYYNLKYAKD